MDLFKENEIELSKRADGITLRLRGVATILACLVSLFLLLAGRTYFGL